VFLIGKLYLSSLTNTSLVQKSVNHCQKKFYNIGPRGQCYKSTVVNYRCNLTLLFLGLKWCSILLPFSYFIIFYSIGYTNSMVIYCYSTVITKIMLLYNTELRHDHGMAINYCRKMFYNIGPRRHCRPQHVSSLREWRPSVSGKSAIKRFFNFWMQCR
jgi:hypothetical protein